MRNRVLLVNFGGPRNIDEVPAFLKELLTDGDVIRTALPKWIQDVLFGYIAKKRSKKIAEDYMEIGGCSPIFEDTEWLAQSLRTKGYEVLTYHRYLPATHDDFLTQAHQFIDEDTIVFPLFPQFSYATTGSIARWMQKHLCLRKSRSLGWIKSYSEHNSFINCFIKVIQECLKQNNLVPSQTLLFFSPHGLPVSYVFEGDIYKKECQKSYHHIMKAFPQSGSVVGYQSQFGKAEWVKPYTNVLSETIGEWNKEYPNVVFIPLSFTSDHIETLFEVEQQYLPAVKKNGFSAYRCPAFNRREDWSDAVSTIIQQSDLVSTQMLIRSSDSKCSCRGKDI
ncbi:MAG: ferrochelatase [Chlamydiae bacterium]|nr:ferrochelatase [Chlamydiota bacterium]